MADTITPFGNTTDDTSPFMEAPDEPLLEAADDAYWSSLEAEHAAGPVEECPVCAPLLRAA